MDYESQRIVAMDAARQAGELLVEWQSKISPREKAPKDLVTEADVLSQRRIEEIVRCTFPDHGFLGEEDTPETPQLGDPPDLDEMLRRHEWLWIVDPLDGTANYVHRLQTYAVSIGLVWRGQLVVGVVHDPLSGETYEAVAGGGARINGTTIQTSCCPELSQAMIAASFSANVPRGSPEVARFIEVNHQSRAVRRLGSAALNLAYVAAGRLDGYFATSVKIWDVAAGLLLVTEAGGTLSSLDGGEFDLARPHFAAACNPSVHRELVAVLKNCP